MNQEEAFMLACGDVWYENNKNDLGRNDPVSDILDAIEPKISSTPKFIVELGCANGWRLKKLRERYKCRTLGLDPSKAAIAVGGGAPEGLYVGIATDVAHKDFTDGGDVDIIIYGYCMSFSSPESYFSILASCDYALRDGGIVIIHDGYLARPMKTHYALVERDGHPNEEVSRYILDFKRLWLAHPHYREIGEILSTDSAESVVALQKVKEGAFKYFKPAEVVHD